MAAIAGPLGLLDSAPRPDIHCLLATSGGLKQWDRHHCPPLLNIHCVQSETRLPYGSIAMWNSQENLFINFWWFFLHPTRSQCHKRHTGLISLWLLWHCDLGRVKKQNVMVANICWIIRKEPLPEIVSVNPFQRNKNGSRKVGWQVYIHYPPGGGTPKTLPTDQTALQIARTRSTLRLEPF